MPVIFCLVRQFLINLFVEVVICSSLQRPENDFTIISKGAFGLFSTSLLWLLDSSPLLSWDFQRTFPCCRIHFEHSFRSFYFFRDNNKNFFTYLINISDLPNIFILVQSVSSMPPWLAFCHSFALIPLHAISPGLSWVVTYLKSHTKSCYYLI